MRKIILYILLCGLVAAEQINLTYSECREYVVFNPDNSTSNLTICAPPLNVPPAVNHSLDYGETYTANNFTATCRGWNESLCPSTTCPPPPAVTINLSYGQTATANNFTATCQAWDSSLCPSVNYSHLEFNLSYGERIFANNVNCSCAPWVDLNLTECPSCVMPEVNRELSYGETYTANNFTASCPAWVDLNLTECPACENCTNANCSLYGKNITLRAGENYVDFDNHFIVTCVENRTGINKYLKVNCSEAQKVEYSDYNFTLEVSQCPVCTACPQSEPCTWTPYSEEEIANCSVKIWLCGTDLSASDCTMKDLAEGKARECLNNTLISRQNSLNTCNLDLNRERNKSSELNDRLTGCQTGQSLANTLIIVMGVVMFGFAVVYILAKQFGPMRRRPRGE
jgi:hypothetical protein